MTDIEIKQKHEYYISGIDLGELRALITAMIEAKEFDHDLEFDIKLPEGSSSFYQVFKVPGTKDTIHFANRIFLLPVRGKGSVITTQLEIHKTKKELPDNKLPKVLPITWDILRAKLDRFGYEITNSDGSEIVTSDHRYIDPSRISHPKYRAVIKALIKAEAGPIYIPGEPPRWKRDKEIAEENGYSPAQFSYIKNNYMRPEFKKKRKEPNNSE